MRSIQTPIIPKQATHAKCTGAHELNLEAICVFAAIGFFLDEDTYWRDIKVLKPAAIHSLDGGDVLIQSESYFKWHYQPRDISFDTALEGV